MTDNHRRMTNDQFPMTIDIKQPIMKMLFRFLCFLCLLTAGLTVRAQRPRPTEPRHASMDAFIRNLMSKMTLEEKIGQLNLLTSDMDVTGPSMRKNYVEDIQKGRVGAIFNAYTPKYVRKLQEMAVNDTR